MNLASLSASLTPSFITPALEASLLSHFPALLASSPARSLDRSRVVRFGWDYRGHQKVLPMPDWAEELRALLPDPRPLDSLTLNEYLPGRAILPHYDPLEFGDPILILGLASACTFELSLGAERLAFEFPARALVSLSGPSRFPWHHAIKPVEALRYSLVFR
jgi:alkylated DNA repair dioxygenase AlkB